MAALSDSDSKIIKDNPLNDALNPLLTPLKEADQLQKTLLGGDKARNTVSRLLSTLLGQPAAFELRATPNGRDVGSELATIFARIRDGEFDYNTYRGLVRSVIQEASDAEIWSAVFDVITTLSRTTPPRTIQSTSTGTPRNTSSGSHRGSQESKTLLDPVLKQELRGKVYKDVGGFFEKYFEGKEWTEQSDAIYEKMQSRHIRGRWVDFPDLPTESAVWEWWSNIQKHYLKDTRGVYYTTRNKTQLTGTDSQRQLDMLMKSAGSNDEPQDGQDACHHWTDVRVIGEHKVSNTEGMDKFVQLARYARDVFTAQPTRRFVHGFLLLGTSLELYVFDRSGAYGAKKFDIHGEPQRFVRVLTGYVLMSDEELGLDTFMERKGKRKFISIDDDGGSGNGQSGKKARRTFELMDGPMVVQRAIVGRGTSCFLNADRKAVVKFSWRSAKRDSEVKFLQRAKEKCVKGVAQLLGHHEVTTIADLRQGLTFSRKRHIGETGSAAGLWSKSGLTASFEQQSIQQPKRKSFGSGPRPSKKSRSTNQTSKLSQEVAVEEDSQATESQVDDAQGPESQPNDSQVSDSQADVLQRTLVAASFAAEEEKFRNRVLSCLAIAPAGRPLEDVKTVPDLVRCIRDAIKAHRSLFVDGKILHRDVSINNIIITDPAEADGFHGTLIDLDMATTVDDNGKNERSGADGMTGTLKYMAIEVVEKAFRDKQRQLDHTFRHDLESFLYVLLDICINCGTSEVGKRKPDRLTEWYIGSYETIVKVKASDMSKRFFEDTLNKFVPAFQSAKPLARSIRDVLFGEGELYTGTPTDPSELYNQTIRAFDEALQQLQW